MAQSLLGRTVDVIAKRDQNCGMTQANERTATLSQLVGKRIKLKLFLAEMSGRELATKLGVSPSWVSYRLSGKQEIGVNDLLRIAVALGVELHDLMPSADEIAAALPVINDPRSGSGRLSRTDEPKPGHHVAPRPFSQPRRDPSRPTSTVSPSRRRPTSVRSPNRPMPR
jgi:transcriptional regulator with XRE-family HTH domain